MGLESMNPTVEAAIIGFAGAVIGAMFSAVITYFTVRSNHKADKAMTDRILASQFITDKRVLWIQNLRNEISLFSANVKFVMGYSKLQDTADYKVQIPEAIIEVQRSARKIQLMLSPKDNKELISLIENVLVNFAGAIKQNQSCID